MCVCVRGIKLRLFVSFTKAQHRKHAILCGAQNSAAVKRRMFGVESVCVCVNGCTRACVSRCHFRLLCVRVCGFCVCVLCLCKDFRHTFAHKFIFVENTHKARACIRANGASLSSSSCNVCVFVPEQRQWEARCLLSLCVCVCSSTCPCPSPHRCIGSPSTPVHCTG